MITDISSTTTVSDMQNLRDDLKDKLTSLESLITKCASERTAKGWSLPGGAASTLGGTTELQAFCALPIAGGYSHKSFINTSSVTYPQIPLVNATNVYPGSAGGADTPININISCNTIFKTDIMDYKK